MLLLEASLKDLDIFKGSLLKNSSSVVVMLEIAGTLISILLILASSFYGIPLTINPVSLHGFSWPYSENKVQVIHSPRITIWHELNWKKLKLFFTLKPYEEKEVLLGKKQEPSNLESLCIWLKSSVSFDMTLRELNWKWTGLRSFNIHSRLQ